jgi:Tfp pilus assembly protein PilF
MQIGLAITYHNWGDLTRALQIYLRLIEKEPRKSQPYEMAAFIYLTKKDIELANKYANLCLEI